MRLSSILLARVIALCALGETNPMGRVFLPSLLASLVTRYQFQQYPTDLVKADLSKGIEFSLGYSPECGTINKLIVYGDGLTIETQSQTAEARAALQEIFDWASKEYGLAYTSETVKRWLYVTTLLFYSDIDLDALHPIFTIISNAMREYSVTIHRPDTDFKAVKIAVDYDHSKLEFPQAAFLLERDKTAFFEEGKYFSESPLPSEKHIALLEEIERSILNASRQRPIRRASRTPHADPA